MDTEPSEESSEPEETNEGPISGLSRRKTLATVLGMGGATMIGASRGADASSTRPPKPRPWNQDVDAGGHELRNLGSLTMASNSTAITDFEGENLSIDANGELNATDDSPWQDTDSDGLLETPESDGIDVGTTETDQLTVGSGSPVTGVWGDSGEFVPLSQYQLPDIGTVGERWTSGDELAVIPFPSFSYTNIEQIYVSLAGALVPAVLGNTIFARLYDETTDTPLTESTIDFQRTQDEVSSKVIDGPKVAYEPDEPSRFGVQVKPDSAASGGGHITSPTIQVWGEIA